MFRVNHLRVAALILCNLGMAQSDSDHTGFGNLRQQLDLYIYSPPHVDPKHCTETSLSLSDSCPQSVGAPPVFVGIHRKGLTRLRHICCVVDSPGLATSWKKDRCSVGRNTPVCSPKTDNKELLNQNQCNQTPEVETMDGGTTHGTCAPHGLQPLGVFVGVPRLMMHEAAGSHACGTCELLPLVVDTWLVKDPTSTKNPIA